MARTDPGRVRASNQDVVGVDPDLGVAVLADGMGGLSRGAEASAQAVTFLLETLHRRAALGQAPPDAAALAVLVADANRHLRQLAEAPGSGGLMGTTLELCVHAGAGRCHLAHVGDSRAYRYRGGVLEQLTQDHSLVQELVREGVLTAAEARHAPNRNVITRALGLERQVQVDLLTIEACSGELLLLCSDGLWDLVSDAALCGELAAVARRERTLADAAARLVDLANRAGGTDNVSLVLLEI
ncbi:MAG: protein phosphatase 2C domain-containing protein [Pseudomonadales bacterium]